jgi:hypothetical protein
LIERGLLLLVSRHLTERHFTATGILYSATDAAAPFIDCLTTEYSRTLIERAAWAVEAFGHRTDAEVKTYFDTNFERWTREFQVAVPSQEPP